MASRKARSARILAHGAWVIAILLGACTGGGGALPGENGDAGASSSGASSSSGSGSSSGASGSSSGASGSSSGSSSGGDASFDATPQDSGCVGTTYQLAFVPPGGGSECGFTITGQPYAPGQTNLELTPGWGTVCHATSSQGCGSGSSADGWWINGNEILLCDATCSRFYDQPNGKLTVRIGCPTKECTH